LSISSSTLPGLMALRMLVSTCRERLQNLGQREEALTSIEEAVTIRRALAGTHPVVFTSRYANSLETLSMILSALGRKADTQAALNEAVAVRNR
jgi:hypothetical protein